MFRFLLGFLLALLMGNAYAAATDRLVWQSVALSQESTAEEMRTRAGIHWQPANKPLINYGFTSDTVWLKTRLPTNLQPNDYILELANLPLDYVTLYVFRNGQLSKTWVSGTLRDWNPEQPLNNNLIFPVQVNPGEQIELLLEVSGHEALMVRPRFLNHDEFMESSNHDAIFMGIYLGIFLALGLYNLMVWLVTKDRNFLRYILFMLGNAMLQLNLFGILHYIVLYQAPLLMEASRTVIPALGFCAFISFSRHFLRLDVYCRWADWAFRGMFWASIGLIPAYLVWGNQLTIYAATLLGQGLAILAIPAGVMSLRRGFRPARFYLLAQGLFFFGGTLFVLTTLNCLPANNFNLYGFQFGAVCETLLIAFSLADQINIMQRERNRAQSDAIGAKETMLAALRATEKQLEARVQERTQQLEVALQLQRQQAEALQSTNGQLTNLNAEKNFILGIAAHDLKNPTSMIINFANLMSDKWNQWDDTKRLERIARIRELAQRIADIIRNLLDINAIETGNYRLDPIAIEIGAACLDLSEQYRDRAEAKAIGLHLEHAGEAFALMDKGAFYQVMDNLLSNAIKYSPKNRRVFISFERAGERVRIRVRDEGPGISADEQTRLFQKFTRLSNKPTGGEHSTGLGLSIVKHIVEASNGRIWCESTVGEGTTFIVELPAHPEAPASPRLALSPPASSD